MTVKSSSNTDVGSGVSMQRMKSSHFQESSTEVMGTVQVSDSARKVMTGTKLSKSGGLIFRMQFL